MRLRLLFADSPVVAAAEQAIRAARVDHVRDAVKVLETWRHTPELTSRERQAVLARFVPPPAELCARCGGGVSYVNRGTHPGWWRHDSLADMAQPHPAQPMMDLPQNGWNSGNCGGTP